MKRIHPSSTPLLSVTGSSLLSRQKVPRARNRAFKGLGDYYSTKFDAHEKGGLE